MKYQVSRVVAGPFLRLLGRPEITGEEHIPRASGAIVASNHLSIVDSFFLPFMFDRFYRAHDANKLAGSGLGLAIVRQAAESCGGFVEASNAPGGGALLRVGFGMPLKPGGEGS